MTADRNGSTTRRALALVMIGALSAAGLTLGFSGTASATAGDAGYAGPSYSSTVGSAPTGEKPESKLWWNDGRWWASMWSNSAAKYDIHYLNRAQHTWVDTGVAIDDRGKSRADTLWDGGHLYVASAYLASSNGSVSTSSSRLARLYRYSYNSGTQTYTLDAGFPVTINGSSSETIALDKDSNGRLWITWTANNKVYYNFTNGSDLTWGTPTALTSLHADDLADDDISTLVAFGPGGDGRIGILWSNQNQSVTYFSSHVDSSSTTDWSTSIPVSIPGTGESDDHLNIKELQSDNDGRVFAVIKTSLNDVSGTPKTAPQIVAAARSASGTWTTSTFGTIADCHTRPVLVLDAASQLVRVYATAPDTGCSFSGQSGSIFEKTSPIADTLTFGSGRGTPVMRNVDAPSLNNVTATKQTVTAASGIVMLASNDDTGKYWFSDEALTPPSASFTATPTDGTAPLSVAFTDTSTGSPTAWSWAFGDGSTSTQQNPQHTYAANGSYTATLTVSNAIGSTQSSQTITVRNAAPVASFTASTLSGPAPLSVDFTDTSTNGPTTWSWEFGDNTVSTQQNPSHTFTSPGSYLVKLTAANATGSTTASQTVTVNAASSGIAFVAAASAENAGATANIAAPVPSGVSAGQVLVATVAARGGPTITAPSGWTLVRSDVDGSTTRVSTYTHVAVASEPASYTFTLSKVKTAVASVAAYSGVSTSTPVSANAGQVNASSSSIVAPSVTGTVGGRLVGAFATARTTTVAPPASMTGRTQISNSAGSSNLTLRLADEALSAAGATGTRTASAGGSSANIGQNIVLAPGSPQGPSAPVASFTASPQSGSAPLTVSFTDTSTNTPTSWSWDFSDSPTSTQQNPSHTFTNPGTYTVTLTATNAQGSNAATQTVTVNPPSSGIAFVAASSGENAGATASVAAPTPAGVAAGQVLVASVAARGSPTITAPAGWTQARTDVDGTTTRVSTFVHVVTGSEPASYTFTLSKAKSAVVSVASYSGVSNSSPVGDAGGQVNGSSSSIVAPSVVGASGARLVGAFVTARTTTVTAPASMANRTQISNSAGSSFVTVELADQALTAAGATGTRTATAGGSSANIGELLTLLPG